MATDDVNIAEDADMAECDGDKVVTMMDVLQEQQDFEEDANAVLGASDDKNCTYSKGYIKRQALYACLTCCTEANVDPTKRAGVCLACSLSCHENHELIELYTKRNFRCDCGNPKFNSHPCQFTPDKADLNDDNVYNQNFSGLYCTCQRPYPDPDSTIEDDMIQCIVCEDWLHASHLEAVVPANDQYSEMVCKNCMEKNEFLHDYSMFAVTVETGDVDIVTVNGDAKSADTSLCNGDSEEKLVNGIEHENETTSVTVNGDVKMDEDKEKSTDEKTVDESATAEISEETKQDESSTVESSELKPEEKEKLNTDANKMDLDTESKIAKQEEQSAETETNESIKTDAPAEDSNNDKEQKETSEDKSNDKPDAAENTPTANPDQHNKTSPKKIESTDENEPAKADETKEQTETKEQMSKQSITDESGDADNRQDNKTDTGEQTEQQLLDDLTSITADNTTLEEKIDTVTEEKPVESMEQSYENKEKDEVETNKEESCQETSNDSEDKSEEKPVVVNETKTGNIEVPDTSQPEKGTKENAAEKTDSVMDAIDELLQTANPSKEEEEEIKKPSSESTDSKETTDNVETKESDVDMSASDNKLDNVPENTEDTAESNNKTITNTEDVEMSDTTTQNEPAGENKDEPKVNENKFEPKRTAVKKKTVPSDGAWKNDKIKTLVSRLATSIKDIDIKPVKKTEIKPKKTRLKLTAPSESKISLLWSGQPHHDKMKHRENLQTILKFSNATPFTNKTLLGYACGYCDLSYPDPADLRQHTEKEHLKERLKFKSNFDMTEYNVKVDIADLNCKICNEKLDSLGVFKDHLVKKHGKTIHNDIKDHIQQFKLKKGEVYDCAMCSSTYETFKMLKQHMNIHYSNYTCSICDSSFATKRSLNAHRTTHQEGSFKCDHCEKVFASRTKKHYHEKMKHLGARNISNCPYCNVPFRSYYQRNQHLVKVHNTEAQYKCNVCNKSYILKSLLMYHIKKSHLMERNCQCTECGYRFFSKKALKAHMVKHTGERNYSCEVCHKSYARKYTLREHMRIHNNDRRFKCEVCSMTFVQKCSLKSHLLSNHGISMAACEIMQKTEN